MKHRSLCLLIAIQLVGAPTGAAAERLTPEQLLASYEKAVTRTSQFRLAGKVDSSQGPGADSDDRQVQHMEFEVYHDRSRWRATQTVKLTNEIGGVSREFPSTLEFLVGNDVLAIQAPSRRPQIHEPGLMVTRFNDPSKLEREVRDHLNVLAIVVGTLPPDSEPLWKLLREATTLEVRPEMELIGGHRTYVVSGSGPLGRRTLWLDPECDYLPRQIESRQRGTELPDARRGGISRERAKEHLRAVAPRRRVPAELVRRVENIRIDSAAGVHMVTAFDRIITVTFEKVASSTFRDECRVETFDFDADKWPVDVFESTIEIPNGTPVFDPDAPGIRFAWVEGKVQKQVDPTVVGNAANLRFGSDSAAKSSTRLIWLFAINLAAAGVLIVWFVLHARWRRRP